MKEFYRRHQRQVTIWILSCMLFATGMIYLQLLSALHSAWQANDHALTTIRKQISDRGRQKVAYTYCTSSQTTTSFGLFLPWELQKKVQETANKVELCRDIVLELDRHS